MNRPHVGVLGDEVAAADFRRTESKRKARST
jgi:hypothetical protein